MARSPLTAHASRLPFLDVFIELTDHLICPADHPESYLVLVPVEMEGRRVVRGELGCPVCGRLVRVMDGIAELGSAPAASGSTGLTAAALEAFLGLSGPGGFIALAGIAAGLAPELLPRMPGIGFVLVNPPPGTVDTLVASVVRSPRLPLRRACLRGAVIGADLAGQDSWIADAARAVLPGLRIVAEGGEPPDSVLVLARSPECWVGQTTVPRRPARSEF